MFHISRQPLMITFLALAMLLTINGKALAVPNPIDETIAESPDSGPGPTVIKVGVGLRDIDSIDSAAQSFVANVFIKLS